MSKPARKRYWRNWKVVDIPKKAASDSFWTEVHEWAHQNKISIVVRENSRPVKNDRYTAREAVWRIHIQRAECATMFMLKWGI